MRRWPGRVSILPMAVPFARFSLNMTECVLLSLNAIPDGGFSEVEAVLDGEPQSLIVHRQGDALQAWLNICPHAGRRLDWAPGQFLVSKQGHLLCAVHGASFEAGSGLCVAGPCRGQSLRAVQVEVLDGMLRVMAPSESQCPR